MDDAARARAGVSAPAWRRPLGVAALTFVIGLVVAAAMGIHQDAQNRQDAQTSFDALTRRVAANLSNRLRRYEYGLRGVRGIVAASGDQRVSREAFRRYSVTRDIDAEFPGARGFGLIRRVPQADEQAFVQSVRRDGWPSFAVRQLNPHEGERWVIKFVEPVDNNRAAVGLDIASETVRREAARRAMRSGRATLTAPIRLVQAERKNGGAFLLLLPIYEAGATLDTEDRREQATVGWSYAPLAIDEVLQGLDTDAEHYTLVLRDVDGTRSEEFFRQRASSNELSSTVAMPIFGRTWQADVSATPAFIDSLRLPPPGKEFLEFALLAALCAGLAAAVTKLVDRTQAQRLEQARRAAIVEGSDDAIVVQTLDGVITDWNQGAERLFGYTAAQALGRTATELLLPPGLEAEDAFIRSTVASGQRFKVLETVRRHRDGSLIEVSIAASPIHAADGRCVGAAKTLRDVREARAAERRVRELNASLEDQVRERTASLEAARRDLQTVLDAMPSQIGYWDTDLRNKVANRAYRHWFGIDPARVQGMHLSELLGPVRFKTSEPQARAALAGQLQTFEESAPGPDGGELRHALVHYLPDVVDGVVRGFYVFVHDVTELTESRLRLAKAQRDNAVLLQTLHQHSIVSVADRAGRIIDVNEAFCRISGYTAQELIGQNHRLVNSGTHDKGFWRDMWRTISSGRSWRGEVCNRAKDGSLYWVDSVVAPFLNAEGEVEKYASIRTNITDRKRTEIELQRTLALLRAMLDASTNVAIVAVDPQGTVSLFNKGAERLLGYGADEVVGRFRAAQPQACSPTLQPDLVLGLAPGRSNSFGALLIDEAVLDRAHEWTCRRKDGSEVPVSMSVTKMADSRGTLIGYLALAQDISARLEHERSLKSAMEQARRANQAKSEFLANMSHEIRTPMNAVVGLSYLLERTTLDADQADMLARLNLAGVSLLAIINDVLDLSKIEAGEMVLERAPFELPQLLRELASLMGVQAQQKGIGYEVELHPQLPPAVLGDSTRLRQVLMNLLSNAIKFTEDGAVTLRARPVDGPRGLARVRFEVADTGIGIDPSTQSRLFEPFVQADASTTRRFGGTGLGLSIVRQLVELMGGSLSLDSVLGEGSVFAVEVDFEACDATFQARALARLPSDGRGLADLCILVVDDNPANRDVARRILEGEGARTLQAGNGLEAVNLLTAGQAGVDAVLMDVQMPVLDGLDATRRIRGVPGLVVLPVIGLTAGVSRSEQERARAAGMNEVLGKPFDPRQLVLTLRSAIGLRTTDGAGPDLPDPAAPLPADWPQLDGVDAADAFARLRGDAALFRSLLARLRAVAAELEPLLDGLEARGGAAELGAAATRLHDLKGMAGTLGARGLHLQAAQAERACREGDAPEVLQHARALTAAVRRLDLPPAPAAAQEPAAPSQAQASQGVRELSSLLARSDLDAVPLFESLRPALRAHLDDAAYDALCRWMDGLDFAAASRELDAIAW